MVNGWLADAVLVLHGLFIVWVVLGALAVAWRRWLAWLHLPAAIWGALIEIGGGMCPLTPLEKSLRAHAGSSGYPGGFIEYYLMPILYPGDLTRGIQMGLGVTVLVVNVLVYRRVFRTRSAVDGGVTR